MNAGAATTRLRPDAGVTLIEILIVTVIIALMAALAFPVYKIVQQREKERRLRTFLNDMRAALVGRKSQLSITSFDEGFRTYIVQQAQQKIFDLHPGSNASATAAMATFTLNIAKFGTGYPPSPLHLASTGYEIEVGTGPTTVPDSQTGSVTIKIDRRFIRRIPPHPFQNWYPKATWKFRPAVPQGSAPISLEDWDPAVHKGVMDIYSSGAGMALDGSNTDEW